MKLIPRILSLLFLWGAVAAIITYVEPDLLKDFIIPGSYLPFYILLILTLWYTLAVIFRSITGSFFMAITLVASIFLNMIKLMHWGLAIVLLLTLVMESWYTYNRHEKIHPTNEQKNRGSGL